MPRRAASFFSDDQDSSEPSQPTKPDTQVHNESSLKSSRKLKKYSKKDRTNPSILNTQEASDTKTVLSLQIQQPLQTSDQSSSTKLSSMECTDELVEVTRNVKSHRREKHDTDHPKKKKKRDKSVSKHSKHRSHATVSMATETTPQSQPETERKHRHSHRSKDPNKHSHVSGKSRVIYPERDDSHEHYEQDNSKYSQKSGRVPAQKSSTRHLTSVQGSSPLSRDASQGSHSSCENPTVVPQRSSERAPQEAQQNEIPQPSKSRKHRSIKSSHSSPASGVTSTTSNVHHSHKSEVPTGRPIVNDCSNSEEKTFHSSVSNTKRSRSPVERSPPKIRRYDSHTLSYGYRQESHRQYSSSRYKSRSRHHRDRSRSPSPRRVSRTRTPTRHGEQDYPHSKPSTKSRSRAYVANDSYETTSRSSRKIHRSAISKHSDEPCLKDSKYERLSTSPSPRESNRSETNAFRVQQSQDQIKHTSRSNSRSQSHSHADTKRDKRVIDYDTRLDQNLTEKSTPNHATHTEPVSCDSRSPSPKQKSDKKRKLEPMTSLISLLTELDTEEVSDTELTTILPPALFTNQIVQRDFNSKNTLKPGSPVPTKDNTLFNVAQNSSDGQKEQDNFMPENNEATALETLEKLSSQVRKHMAEPETWDLNDLGIPCETDEDHAESAVNESVVNLASRKIIPQQQQQRLSTMLASLCTPWQELINSAAKTLNSTMTTSESDSAAQPLGALLENSNGHFVPLHKRASGFEALRLTGISQHYLGQELTTELCNQYSDLTNAISNCSSLAWGHRSSLLHPCSSLKLSQLSNQSSDRIFGGELNVNIPFGAKLDLTIRRHLLGLANG